MKFPLVILKRSEYERLKRDLAVSMIKNRELKEEIIALRYESRRKAQRKQ